VQLHAVDATHAQRQQRPFVFEPSELALDGCASAVEATEAKRLVRDQRMEAIGSDPR
jgi:hypothetical protein